MFQGKEKVLKNALKLSNSFVNKGYEQDLENDLKKQLSKHFKQLTSWFRKGQISLLQIVAFGKRI